MTAERPVFLDLRRIHLPVCGWASILHRIAGALLALAVPALGLSFAQALSSPAGFAATVAVFEHPLTRLLLLLWFWAFAHHLLAGIRHLLLDLGFGINLRRARQTAWASLGGALALAVLWAGIALL